MSKETRDAVKALNENLKLFVSPQKDPAEYNRQVAMRCLAQAIEGIENQLYALEQTIKRQGRG